MSEKSKDKSTSSSVKVVHEENSIDKTSKTSSSKSTKNYLNKKKEEVNDKSPAQLTCMDVYCRCNSPVFQSCQCCAGILEIFCPGLGLCLMPCCYGCDKPDRCSVCIAGFSQWITTPFIIGIVSSCCIGWKLLFCC